jgi:hypothetical protein
MDAKERRWKAFIIPAGFQHLSATQKMLNRIEAISGNYYDEVGQHETAEFIWQELKRRYGYVPRISDTVTDVWEDLAGTPGREARTAFVLDTGCPDTRGLFLYRNGQSRDGS